jgi:hypothetical protein
MLADRASIVGRVLQALRGGHLAAARDTLCTEYPFVAVVPAGRRYTEMQSLQVFMR